MRKWEVESKDNQAFTLIELSIVVVVIALIVAGVVAGQSLVNQAKLRQTVNEVGLYKSAITNFRLVYDQFPGDFDNAHAYWDDGADGVCGTLAQCNGNNNQIYDSEGTDETSEHARAWQHMYLAGILTNFYDGVAVNASPQTWSSVDLPHSANGKTMWGLASTRERYIFQGTGETILKEYMILNTGKIGGNGLGSNLTVQEAYNIDLKVDDGIANKGKAYGVDGNFPSPDADGKCNTSECCSENGNVIGGADYYTPNLASDINFCRMAFFLLR